jgi:hypothetical protein
MTFSIKQMEDRIAWLKTREAKFREGVDTTETPLDAEKRDDLQIDAEITPLDAANTLDLAIEIIAELSGRLSAAEELLANARRPIRGNSQVESGRGDG